MTRADGHQRRPLPRRGAVLRHRRGGLLRHPPDRPGPGEVDHLPVPVEHRTEGRRLPDGVLPGLFAERPQTRELHAHHHGERRTGRRRRTRSRLRPRCSSRGRATAPRPRGCIGRWWARPTWNYRRKVGSSTGRARTTARIPGRRQGATARRGNSPVPAAPPGTSRSDSIRRRPGSGLAQGLHRIVGQIVADALSRQCTLAGTRLSGSAIAESR